MFGKEEISYCGLPFDFRLGFSIVAHLCQRGVGRHVTHNVEGSLTTNSIGVNAISPGPSTLTVMVQTGTLRSYNQSINQLTNEIM